MKGVPAMKGSKILKCVLPVIILLIIFYIAGINYYWRDKAVISRIKSINGSIRTVTDSDLTIMTYNIHHGVGHDGKLNMSRIQAIIEQSGARIIGLNEVDNKMFRSRFQNQAKILADNLGMSYVFAPAMRSIVGSYGNAIITSFKINEVRNHPLPVKIGFEPRGMLEAEVILPGGRVLHVFSTHLSHEEKERARQMEWINNYIRKLDSPFVLMGDFNGERGVCEEMDLFLETDMTFPAGDPGRRLDVFLSNCNITESYTLHSGGSDHLPFVIKLNWSGGKLCFGGNSEDEI
uniref:Endonuclease/exonuclease/phosphatase n=1 Tax=uncultured organism TaxID=155900 RepID=M1PQQ8_9ZZZZ|nr:endonuclease/exonuclease/phosphatase [uncultured organism]